MCRWGGWGAAGDGDCALALAKRTRIESDREMRISAAVGVLVLSTLLASPVVAQNSSRKIRARPSTTAARAGTAVRWREDLETAQAESKKTGKPVFWYVPTVAGSPMDRKPEIDRYMMAGPFSWPRMIQLLNDHYVPVRARARGGVARDLGLQRGKFIEPGYVVLDAAGKELLRRDQLTTFHEEWMLGPLAAAVQQKTPPRKEPSVVEQKMAAARRMFHRGETKAALDAWKKIAKEHPENPLAWKAAAEAEGHGPLRFGFEVDGPLPDAVMRSTVPGTRAPSGVYSAVELRRRSLAFLCRMQLENGGFEDSRYDFGGTDSLPNVYVACTAIVAHALLEELQAKPMVGDEKAMSAALEKAIAYLLDSKRINPKDTDEMVWAHIYRVHFFTRYLEIYGRDKKDEKKVAAVRDGLVRVVRDLYAMQPGSGCWFHEYQNPFVCADVLVALHRALAVAEIPLDEGKVAQGKKALMRCRAKTGAFTYGYSGRPGGSIKGAAGRMPLCELALLRCGASDQKRLEAAVDASFEHHELMNAVRKYDDHASRYGYGGFFFWFDMLGRTRALLALGDEKARIKATQQQRDLIVQRLPEIDGCFVDSHELGRTYGTGMALLCLAALRK